MIELIFEKLVVVFVVWASEDCAGGFQQHNATNWIESNSVLL
jgi:hypothetical protein